MRIAVLVTIIGLVMGCGRSESLSRVEGTVTLDGRPLPECNVVFVPTGLEGHAVTGRTGTSGSFEAHAKPAEYALLFNLLPASGASDSALKAEGAKGTRGSQTLPAIYGDVAQTPWKVKIPATAPLALQLRSQ